MQNLINKMKIGEELEKTYEAHSRAVSDYALNGYSNGREKRLIKLGTKIEELTQQLIA